MDKIGDNIRKIRTLLDVKQATMAQMLKISINYYGKIERNEIKVKPERLTEIAHTLGVAPETITNLKQFMDHIKQTQSSKSD